VRLVCAYCHDTLSTDAARYCAACLTPQHPECAAEHGRCVSLGCGESRTVGAVRRGWSGWTVLAAVGFTAALLVPLGWWSEGGRSQQPNLLVAPPAPSATVVPPPAPQVHSVYDYQPLDLSEREATPGAEEEESRWDPVAAARASAVEHMRAEWELAEGAFARGEAAWALNLLSELLLSYSTVLDDDLELQLEARLALVHAVYGRWQRSQALGVRAEALQPLAEILELLADEPDNHYYGAAQLMHAHVALYTR